MKAPEPAVAFDEQMGRILRVTGTRTQVELADVLGIRQASISDAKRRGKIPAEWLITIMRARNVHPDWILTGNCDEKTGLITAELLSDGMMDKFFDDLIAEGMSTVKISSMREMHVDLVGYQRLAALVKKSASTMLSENGPYIRVRMPKVILELFGMEELEDFILGQFPEHKAGPSGPHFIGEMFALDLVPITPADSAS